MPPDQQWKAAVLLATARDIHFTAGKKWSIIVAVSHLAVLMKDQEIGKTERNVRAVNVGDAKLEDAKVTRCAGSCQVAFLSPEALLRDAIWWDMLQGQQNACSTHMIKPHTMQSFHQLNHGKPAHVTTLFLHLWLHNILACKTVCAWTCASVYSRPTVSLLAGASLPPLREPAILLPHFQHCTLWLWLGRPHDRQGRPIRGLLHR